jgi:hypothetical protein
MIAALGRRNLAGERRHVDPMSRVIRRDGRILTMIRSPGAGGFDGCPVPVASSRLTHAVAASLAIGALSLCLIVTLTVLSIKVTQAMPLPA